MSNRKPALESTDQEAINKRNFCDYNIKITLEAAREGKVTRPIRVYADGVYDLFHSGHARQLRQAKDAFPLSDVYLVVGCCSDALTHSMKGKTVMHESERYESILHCRYVDELIKDAPWTITEEFLTQNKIDFVAHDEIPYGSDSSTDIYSLVKEKGMFLTTQRTEGVSTSDVVARIVKDYDMYVRRNLARGYTAKELNVSFINEKKFRLQNKIDDIKIQIKERKDEVVNKVMDTHPLIASFIALFGPDGPVTAIWNQTNRSIKQVLSPEHSPSSTPVNLSPSSSTVTLDPQAEEFSDEEIDGKDKNRKRSRYE